MAARVWGIVCGALVAWSAMAALGVAHRYLFAPTMAPFGSPDLFLDMSVPALWALVGVRGFAALLGAGVASGLSGWRHAAWTGPIVVMLCAVVTVSVTDMVQPWWTLIATLVLVVLIGLLIGRKLPDQPAGTP